MQATKETVQKRPHTALWIILCVVLLCAAGAALYFCRWAEKPLTLAEGYVAAEGLTADITDGEGTVLSQPVRGTKVTYVVEDEDKDHPGLVRLVLGEDSFGYLPREQLVTDPKEVVATKTIYVRTAVNLLDEAGAVPGRLVQKGEALTVTGWQDMDASGAVGRWPGGGRLHSGGVRHHGRAQRQGAVRSGGLSAPRRTRGQLGRRRRRGAGLLPP